VSKVIWHITMSLDGFIAGSDDSMDWVVGEWSDDGTNTRDIEVGRSSMAEEVLGSAEQFSEVGVGMTSPSGCTTALMASTAASGRGRSLCSRTGRRRT
jgi:hypothetical protein